MPAILFAGLGAQFSFAIANRAKGIAKAPNAIENAPRFFTVQQQLFFMLATGFHQIRSRGQRSTPFESNR